MTPSVRSRRKIGPACLWNRVLGRSVWVNNHNPHDLMRLQCLLAAPLSYRLCPPPPPPPPPTTSLQFDWYALLLKLQIPDIQFSYSRGTGGNAISAYNNALPPYRKVDVTFSCQFPTILHKMQSCVSRERKEKPTRKSIYSVPTREGTRKIRQTAATPQ